MCQNLAIDKKQKNRKPIPGSYDHKLNGGTRFRSTKTPKASCNPFTQPKSLEPAKVQLIYRYVEQTFCKSSYLRNKTLGSSLCFHHPRTCSFQKSQGTVHKAKLIIKGTATENRKQSSENSFSIINHCSCHFWSYLDCIRPMFDSGKLPTYPAPKPTFYWKWGSKCKC